MSDGRTERALGLRPLHVDMDPLVVAAQTGKRVDVVLGHLAPVAPADRLAQKAAEPLDSLGCRLRPGRGSVTPKGDTPNLRPASLSRLNSRGRLLNAGPRAGS